MPSDATEAALGLLGLTNSAPPSTVPLKRKSSDPSSESEQINCICGFTYDDGFSIGCDKCARWCHAACFNINQNEVPDEWQCWVCDPRPVDRDRAVKLQKNRQRAAVERQRRRASPGVERKPRRPSGILAEPNTKRKRRVSIMGSAQYAHGHTHKHDGEDEHVDIDEPWTHSYVPITRDLLPHDETGDMLQRVATEWRGITALSPSPLTPGCSTPVILDDVPPPHISLRPVAPSQHSSFANGNPAVHPPSYSVHATQPIPTSRLITSYPSTITPSAAYLRDPLNSYAHLGMPKPFVHLIGPPLDVALDARLTGSQSRYVRSGCHPNAVLRPMLCPPKSDDDPAAPLSFGIFALRDLKANEEVVLGWEWDDGHVVHHLPALMESPNRFIPAQVQMFRAQITSMLHALASTYATCACGAKAKDCALARMAEFVEGQTPLTPEPSPPSQFARTKTKEREVESAREKDGVDLGPLIGIERGFRTRERIPSSGGFGGVEMVVPEAGPSRLAGLGLGELRKVDRKGKGREVEDDEDSDGSARSSRKPSGEVAMDVDRERSPPPEQNLPPKMRKAWIKRSFERLREMYGTPPDTESRAQEATEDVDMGEDGPFDSREMPPPPVPYARSPPMLSTTHPHPLSSHTLPTPRKDSSDSPSLPFSKLSLLSPVVRGPSPSPGSATSPTIHSDRLPAVTSLSAAFEPKGKAKDGKSAKRATNGKEKAKPNQSEDVENTPRAKKTPARARKPKVAATKKDVTSDSEASTSQRPAVTAKPDKPKKARSRVTVKGPPSDGETPVASKPKSKPRVKSKDKNGHASDSDASSAQASSSRAEAVRVKRPSISVSRAPSSMSPSLSMSTLPHASPSPVLSTASLPRPSTSPSLPPTPLPRAGSSTPRPSTPAVVTALRAVSVPRSIASTVSLAELLNPQPPDPSPPPLSSSVSVAIVPEERVVTPPPPDAPSIKSVSPVDPHPRSPSPPPVSRQPSPIAAPPTATADAADLFAAPDVSVVSAQDTSQEHLSQAVPVEPDAPAAMEVDQPEAPAAATVEAATDPPAPSPTLDDIPSSETVSDALSAGDEVGKPVDGPAPLPSTERDPSPPIEPAPEPPSEPIAQPPEPEPQAEPEPVPEPPPPPPPKVKLSLKDFAMRKKKQREEAEKVAASPSVNTTPLPPASPVVALAPLPEREVETKEVLMLADTLPPLVYGSRPSVRVQIPVSLRRSPSPPPSPPPPAPMDDPPSSPIYVEPEEERRPPVASPVQSAPKMDVEERRPSAHDADLRATRAGHADTRDTRAGDVDQRGMPAGDADESSWRAKAELIEDVVPRSPRRRDSPSRSRSPVRRPQTPRPRTPVPEEDGEIFSPPPPKAPPLAPPTQPRSFYARSGTTPPYHARQPPNAPRALRGPPTYYAPRGPSAERGREWGRERGAWPRGGGGGGGGRGPAGNWGR